MNPEYHIVVHERILALEQATEAETANVLSEIKRIYNGSTMSILYPVLADLDKGDDGLRSLAKKVRRNMPVTSVYEDA